MIGGYWNKVLRVNLSTGLSKVESLPNFELSEYIGGSALGSRLLYDEVSPGIKGLMEENKIIFALGPYQGTNVPGSGKWVVISKSPQTGTFAVSAAGASWGHRLKKAGYDVLIIEGKSDKPVYLWINNDIVQIKSADHLWGIDSIESTKIIKTELAENDISAVTIGPAGEKLVSIACLIADEHSFAGRCGFGAVMGSKMLKAIAVRGTKNVQVHNEKQLKELKKNISMRLSKNADAFWRKYGTPGFVSSCEEVGDMPLKNWSGDVWPEGAKKIGGYTYNEILNAKSWPCHACPVGCHRYISISNHENYPSLKLEGAGPEYENLGHLGGNCLVDDLVSIAVANDICNRLGIDAISAGAFVAFLMECFEKGIISKNDLNGIEPKWGDGKALIELVKQIGNKEGIGKLFANGIREAAEKIGQGAQELTVEVKNLDMAAHDPRTYFSLAINYATSTRGACHLRGYPHFGEAGPDPGIKHIKVPERFNMEGQSKLAMLFQDWATIQDSLCICIYMYSVGMSANEHIDVLNAITGWRITPEEFFLVGERAWNLQRLINIGDGLTRADDRLPKKMFIPAKKGFRAGKTPYELEKYLDEYYELRGWDNNGFPTDNKLKQLRIK